MVTFPSQWECVETNKIVSHCFFCALKQWLAERRTSMALAIQDRYEGYGCKVQYTIGSDENPKGKKYLFTHIASDHTDEQLLKFAEAVEMLFDGFLLEFDVINDTKITVAPADKKPATPATEE